MLNPLAVVWCVKSCLSWSDSLKMSVRDFTGYWLQSKPKGGEDSCPYLTRHTIPIKKPAKLFESKSSISIGLQCLCVTIRIVKAYGSLTWELDYTDSLITCACLNMCVCVCVCVCLCMCVCLNTHVIKRNYQPLSINIWKHLMYNCLDERPGSWGPPCHSPLIWMMKNRHSMHVLAS